MSRILQALTGEPWAIDPSWLPLILALAQRNHDAATVKAAEDWQRRDYETMAAIMAGPGVQKLAGSQRTSVANGVAIIPVVGPIFPRANMMTEMSGATSVTMLQQDYRAALDSKDVNAIMLLVDSPGGAVSGIQSFSDMVNAGAKKKMTAAHVAGTAASAAYWIASQAPELTIERTGLVGSIGVVCCVPKQVQPGADGYVDVEVVSSNAPNKRPDPTTEDGLATIRDTLDSIEGEFIADVARGRNTTVAKVKAEFKAGGTEIGAKAVAAGMADRVISQEAQFKRLAQYAANQRKLDSFR